MRVILLLFHLIIQFLILMLDLSRWSWFGFLHSVFTNLLNPHLVCLLTCSKSPWTPKVASLVWSRNRSTWDCEMKCETVSKMWFSWNYPVLNSTPFWTKFIILLLNNWSVKSSSIKEYDPKIAFFSCSVIEYLSSNFTCLDKFSKRTPRIARISRRWGEAIRHSESMRNILLRNLRVKGK